MAKEIDKIIQSKTAPKSNNVLWDDGENLKINRNGKWENTSKRGENSIPNGVSNRLSIFVEWFSGKEIEDGYVNINAIDNNDSEVFKFLKSIIRYDNFGLCKFDNGFGTVSYLPLTSIRINTDGSEYVYFDWLDRINNEIFINFGIALDDNNDVFQNVKLKYFPDIKTWGIKLFEI